MTQQHTPTPILAERLESLLRQFTVWNEECERIVRAVNSHDELIETVGWIVQTVHRAHHDGPINTCAKHTCDAARQAIAKAEGK